MFRMSAYQFALMGPNKNAGTDVAGQSRRVSMTRGH